DQLFFEGTGATIAVRVTATDAEVGVASVTVKFGNGPQIPLTLDPSVPNGWLLNAPVPNVDGTDPVPVAVVVTASDYEGNSGTATQQIRIQPLNDPNAPVVYFTCPSANAMFPAGYAVRLRVHAIGNNTGNAANGVTGVSLTVNGGAPIAAAPIADMPDEYEAMYTVPADAADGASFNVEATVTNAASLSSGASTSFTVVAGTIVAADRTVADASLDHQTVIVQGGVLTLEGARTFARLIVLDGAMVTHAPSSNLNIVAEQLYVACGGAIDVTGKGYAGHVTDPNASPGDGSTGGSHIGRGGASDGSIAGSTYGSIERPQEPGGGGGSASDSAGGGVIRLNTTRLVVDGAIRANGSAATGFAGAGGSIWITTGTISGRGIVDASGGGNVYSGGGGAIALEFSDAASTLPQLSTSSVPFGFYASRWGGAGSVVVKGPQSTFGGLTIDEGDRSAASATELPSLGSGTGQDGSGGATLVTDLTTDVPQYFVGRWIEITGATGALKGTWRIASIANRTITLQPNAGETIAVVPGDRWQGVYRVDALDIHGAMPFTSVDPVRLTPTAPVTLRGPAGSDVLDMTEPLTGGSVTVDGTVAASEISPASMTVNAGATLTSHGSTLTINAGALAVDGAIDVSGKGYVRDSTYPGASVGTSGTSGSHIGVGSGNQGFGSEGSTYGSVERPRESGAGGTGNFGDSGGGVVRINAATLRIDGAIRSNAQEGAGGSIWITAGRITGTGLIDAGSANGGGGAVAIEYADRTTVLPAVHAGSANTGAGSVLIKGPDSTFGDLRVEYTYSVGETRLPPLGRGVAQTGSTAATLVTDRSESIPPYFEGHWVEVTTAAGVLKGTWRIATIAGTVVTLQPNNSEAIDVQPGDSWQGVYRFDNIVLSGSGKLTSHDPIRSASGTVHISGPVSGDPFEVSDPISADTVLVEGRVRAKSIAATNLTIAHDAVVESLPAQSLSLDVSAVLTIDGAIDASGKGFPAYRTYPGIGRGNVLGGTHIGGPAGTTYGSVSRPQEPGAGGAHPYYSGSTAGGGVVR
ncbi:MAG: hypothetical protein ACXVJT_08965, partial [Thermoanaerobaculia bacterium]